MYMYILYYIEVIEDLKLLLNLEFDMKDLG